MLRSASRIARPRPPTSRRLATFLAAVCVLSSALALSPQGKETPGAAAAQPRQPTIAATPSRYRPERFAGRAGTYYRVVWGVDSLSVKVVESGEIIRFTWRVLDADKATVLNDKKTAPALIDPRAGVSLVVPSLEKVGQLRQGGETEEGKHYWMAFSNKGRLVKRGDRVSVVIGQFRADGLVVD